MVAPVTSIPMTEPAGPAEPGPTAAPASEAITVRLAELRVGERARLCATELDEHDGRLLQAMGLIDQCELRVCRCGEPCIVQVNATRLGVSSLIARCILVERAPAPSGD